MAKIIKKTNDLENEYQRYKKSENTYMKIAEILCVVVLAGFVLFICGISSARLLLTGVMVIIGGGALTVWCFFKASFWEDKAKIVAKGVEGESATRALIQSLPDNYYGFSNVKISYEGQTSELDMVVAGPGGVFIIETKNHNGGIRGTYDGRKWVQSKVGRGGTAYSNEFYSPVKQVGTHVYRLAHFLRDKGTSVHVNGVVYFSNADADVEILGESKDIPVFSCREHGEEFLKEYIQADENKLSRETVNMVCKLLS